MPQDLHVVKCYSCNTFQVDIVKKVKKWSCKMCGEKQSLMKVYGNGTGKDCRELVQHLNKVRLEGEMETSNAIISPHKYKDQNEFMPQGAPKINEYDDESHDTHIQKKRRVTMLNKVQENDVNLKSEQVDSPSKDRDIINISKANKLFEDDFNIDSVLDF